MGGWGGEGPRRMGCILRAPVRAAFYGDDYNEGKLNYFPELNGFYVLMFCVLVDFLFEEVA